MNRRRADVAALIGDGAGERVCKLGVHLLVQRIDHLEDAEGHAFEHDILTDHTGNEVLLVHLLKQDFRKLHQVGRAY